LALILLSLSLVLKFKTNKLKKQYKIQEGNIIYSDLNKTEKALFSKRYRLSGKPDYILKKDEKFFPVEIKTGNHYRPKKNHILQLAAYCHLLEENFNTFISKGILIYTETSLKFDISFDPKLRYELESTIKKMRESISGGNIIRNHNNSKKCKFCSMRQYCNEKLI
jgi:CRISPR-associated exonuclease Cas4